LLLRPFSGLGRMRASAGRGSNTLSHWSVRSVPSELHRAARSPDASAVIFHHMYFYYFSCYIVEYYSSISGWYTDSTYVVQQGNQ
jgi:hypothetical protein